MDQGVIEKMKRSYRKQLLRRLLLAEKDEESVIEFVKKVNLKDCIYMLADAWESLTETNLQRAWRKLWPYEEEKDDLEEGDIDGAVNEISEICSTLPGFEECNKDDAMECLAVDSNDSGFQILTDQEIADMLNEDETETMESDSDDNSDKTEETGPTHSEAFVAAEALMSWLEKQNESSPTQLILLKRIKDLAAKKRTTTAVQKAITDFFKSSNM
ncbi:jerky protein homolog-like [Diabrotica virgifera virgifera]|uniref:Jerky protein homolog-like n=1 Tax=Diabrotica virgifera virgifera TaxID=50390 RepID=A0A6P7GE59_DIAVI|nr:jerky protein homolog-like [Diabrotica virgifera virgifera]